ncbi:MAG: hypothetical protein V3S41_09275 [Spirochaetia bacterium]
MNRLSVLVRASVALAILVAPVSGIASDEATINPERLAGGSIFAEEEHPSISLDREILFVHVPAPPREVARENIQSLGYGSVGEYAEFIAIFEFNRPDGRDDEVVDVTFPLEIVSTGAYGSGPLDVPFYEEYLSWAEARDRPDPERPGESIRSVTVSVKDYPTTETGIQIRQDGQEVWIRSVIIERRRTETDSIYSVHFIHRLRFPPGSRSTVTVRYRQYSFNSFYVGRSYRAHYVIGTGSTWAGPIGEFALLTVPPLVRAPDGFIDGATIGPPYYYNVKNWEPDMEDRFEFFWNEETPLVGAMDVPDDLFWGPDQLTESAAPTDPDSRLVFNPTASSFYPGTTTALLNDTNYRTTYGPSAAFDGIPTNGWVENADGPGLREYLEFELREPVLGARIYNGLRLVPPGLFPPLLQDQYDPDFTYLLYTNDTPGFQGYERRLSIWQRNHRVSALDIETSDGIPLFTIPLQDAWAQPAVSFYLPPGRYRATIDRVYPTKEWADTAIGEIVFFTNTDAMRDFTAGGSLSSLFDELVQEINDLLSKTNRVERGWSIQ